MGQAVKQYFENYPTVDQFFFTSDGLAFFNENNANDHSRNLDDKNVTAITRNEAFAPEVKMLDVVVTQDMLDENPDLAAGDVKVGDTIQVPVDDTQNTADEIKADVKEAVVKKTVKKAPAKKSAKKK